MSKLVGAGSYHEWEIQELRKDREFAVEYLKATMEALSKPAECAGGLLALRAVAEAYGGLGAVATAAGISRESLYRSLSPKGNPTLKTLIAVVNTMGCGFLSWKNVRARESAQNQGQRGRLPSWLASRMPLPSRRHFDPVLEQRQDRR